jgi:predicted amidohydrolase
MASDAPRRWTPGRACRPAASALLTGVLAVAGCAPPDEAPATCAIEFTDRGDVRVFVVGHHFVLPDADGYAAFEASFRRHMERIAPCLSDRRPNLLTFPEDAALVGWFIGRRAMLARGAPDAELAFNAMYAGYHHEADAYRRRFPGISEARALTLALGDTAWRAIDGTFAGLAREYGVWVVTSMNLPDAEWTDDRDLVRQFGDPDLPRSAGAFVARSPEVFNMALLYDPEGDLVGRVDKVYLTDPEEQLLDLSNGPLDALEAWDTPFGRVGAAISRDAFYAPFMQRMEDLGVSLVVQPEAFSGWGVPVEEGDWSPDVIHTSGWVHTQKYRGIRHNVMPVLAGNLFDMVFDGQVWITRKATPDQPLQHLVGSEAQPGWLEIGPWVMDDPVARDRDLSLEERRRILAERGVAMLPGAGRPHENAYVDSLVAADLFLHGESETPGPMDVRLTADGFPSRPIAPRLPGHQINPAGAYDDAGRLYVAWSDSASAAGPRIRLAVSDDDGLTWTASDRPIAEHAFGRQLRPSVAAGRAGQVVVAWQEAGDGGPERIRIARSTDGGASFAVHWLEATDAAQWEPALAFAPDGDAVLLAFTDFRDGLAPKIRYALSPDTGGTWSAPARVASSGIAAERIEGTQVQPAVAWSPSAGLVVAWLDYRDRDWKVFAASGTGDGFRAAEQVTPGSDHEILASNPRLAVGPAGEVLLAWDDQRERRGHHDVRAAVRRPGEVGWRQVDHLEGGADAGVATSRFRPTVGALPGGDLALVFQDLSPRKNALGFARVAGGDLGVVVQGRFDDTGDTHNQMTRPQIVMRRDHAGGVVLFEDDRAGWSRVRTSPLSLPEAAE